MPRALLIAEAANPEWVSVPLIGWSLARAIAARMPAHLVTQVRNRDPIIAAGLIEGRDFSAIDSERVAAPLAQFAQRIRGGPGVGWTTVSAAAAISYYYFEYLVWRQFGAAILSREFDVVHRITPLSPTAPSLLARRCARAGVPFVLGPLNGGAPWPAEFEYARRKEREWLSYVRSAYKFLPGYRSTLFNASAIIVGSRSTQAEIPERFYDKCIYVPENAIDPNKFSLLAASVAQVPLRACFVGRLVPYKGPDMLLEAVSALVRSGKLMVEIIGDGPMMPDLRETVRTTGLQAGVTLHGWVAHQEVQALMAGCQLLLFPSIREFGGGVVLEAMAMGIVPVVVDYAGPGELVDDDVGYKVPIGSREQIVASLRSIVTSICNEPEQLLPKAQAARARTLAYFTWDVKAAQMIEIYDWVAGRISIKPRFFEQSPEFRGTIP